MKRRRSLVRIPIAVVVLGGIAAAYFGTRTSAQTPSYRLASVSYGAVTATISGIGTLQPTNSATVVPPISGTVASVDVTVGEKVTSGQTLATITPPSSATETVATDEAALAVAQATLTDAQQSTTTTTTTSSTTTTTVAVSGTSSALQTAQQSYQALCTGPAATSANATACASLERSLQQLSRAQSTPSSSQSSPQQNQAGRSTTPTTISAAQISADQAAVTADQQALTLAQQDVAGTVTAPATGVVAAISMTAGSSVRTQSTTQTITIIDPSSIEVVLPVPTSESTQIHNGDKVTVSLEGRSQTYDAEVISIGTTPTTSQSTGVTTVPVTALLGTKAIANFDGALADTTITTANISHSLSVPTSALTNTGGHYSVTVVKSGQASQVSVKVGAIGAARTAIISGLTDGEQVALANLNKPLPTAQSTFGGGAGGFRARITFGGGGAGFAGARGAFAGAGAASRG